MKSKLYEEMESKLQQESVHKLYYSYTLCLDIVDFRILSEFVCLACTRLTP